MIDICPICQIATPCDCEDDHVAVVKLTRKEKAARCVELVERLASMPSTDEDMISTMCPPDWDDLCDWWREFVEAARDITGKSYNG